MKDKLTCPKCGAECTLDYDEDDGLRVTDWECGSTNIDYKLTQSDKCRISELKSTVAELEQENARLRRCLETMNGVTRHQTARNEFGHPYHPLTCGNDSRHQPLFPKFDGTDVVLVCADCDYVQEWNREVPNV